MSKPTYVPDLGDIVLVDFKPSARREIDKRRPAVLLSGRPYNNRSGLCVAVPITSRVAKGPMWVNLPDGLLPRPGRVLCDQIRSLDWRERQTGANDWRNGSARCRRI